MPKDEAAASPRSSVGAAIASMTAQNAAAIRSACRANDDHLEVQTEMPHLEDGMCHYVITKPSKQSQPPPFVTPAPRPIAQSQPLLQTGEEHCHDQRPCHWDIGSQACEHVSQPRSRGPNVPSS